MNTKLSETLYRGGGWSLEAINALIQELKDNFRGFKDHTHVEICAYPEVTIRRKVGGRPETLCLDTWDVYAYSAGFAYIRETDILFVHLPVRAR